jgi:UDP-2,4-diacetamido-2,4,6-trideoxy-beta-L-altropyranose hydrolase
MSAAEGARQAVVFRTTAGRQVGFGHLRRCITLADELAARGSDCVFWLANTEERNVPGGISYPVTTVDPALEPGTGTAGLPGDAGMLIVDDYAVAESTLSAFGNDGERLTVVIDDLADRRLDVDAVINPGAAAHLLSYAVGERCVLLLGAQYALLRPSFRGAASRAAPEKIGRVLVTLGGSDPENRTGAVLETVLRRLPDCQVDLVIGPFFDGRIAISAGPRVRSHRAPADLAPLMAEADLAVSAGGQTTYELAAMGVPTLALCLAPNQKPNLEALAALGALRHVGDETTLDEELGRIAGDAQARGRLSDTARRLVDGRGAARAAERLLALGRQHVGAPW